MKKLYNEAISQFLTDDVWNCCQLYFLPGISANIAQC
jgi:hypothetical protein